MQPANPAQTHRPKHSSAAKPDAALPITEWPATEWMQLLRNVAQVSVWMALVLILLLCAITYPW